MVNDDLYEAVPLSDQNRNRLWIVAVLVLAICLTVIISLIVVTRHPEPTPKTPHNQRTRPLAWIKNSSVELAAKRLLQPTVDTILADMGLGNNASQWFEHDLWVNSSYHPKKCQAQAWKWLVSDSSVASYSPADGTTRYVLAVLYYQARGPDWGLETGWLDTSRDVCDWSWFSRRGSGFVYTCRRQTGLTRLSLQRNGYVGSLPKEIGMLTQLTALSVTWQKGRYDPISSSLARLSQLQELSLAFGESAGRIPPAIGMLSKLTHLSLSGSALLGSFPSSMTRLSLLLSVDISFHDMFELPQDLLLVRWPHLTSLTMASVSRSPHTLGEYPSSVSLLTSLETLIVQGIGYNGTLPHKLANLTDLRTLELGRTLLSGPLPATLARLTQLERLVVSNNQFVGTLPDVLFQAFSSLTSLTVSGNLLTGALSTDIGSLRQLSQLTIGESAMTGVIPTEVGLLTFLSELSLSDSGFSGAIPSELSELYRLTSLELDLVQELEGLIPTEICDLTWKTPPLALYATCDVSLTCTGCCIMERDAFSDDYENVCTQY